MQFCSYNHCTYDNPKFQDESYPTPFGSFCLCFCIVLGIITVSTRLTLANRSVELHAAG
jgi:hypothetical protein